MSSSRWSAYWRSRDDDGTDGRRSRSRSTRLFGTPDQTGNPQPTARFLNLVRLVGDSHRIGFWKTKLSTDIGQPSRGHGSGRVSGAAVSTRSTRAKLAESNIHSGRGHSRSPERPWPANTSVCWTWGFAASISQRLGGSSVAAERDCHVWTRRHGRYRRKRGRTRATKHRSVGGGVAEPAGDESFALSLPQPLPEDLDLARRVVRAPKPV